MNYCKYLKKRKNKPYCKLLDKEITFSHCRECDNKEYKINNKKCTIFVKNETFYTENAQNNKKIVQNLSNKNQIKKKSASNGKSPVGSGKIKNKSNKQAKKERERFSVFTSADRCFVCKSTYQLTWNEIYRGRNRSNSMEDGFCLRMCLNCHRKFQDDTNFNDFWHREAQLYFEEHYGTKEDFIKKYRRNYL